MEIEFTSRYGTKVPSWLTACLECEAMGCNPPSRELFGTTEEWLDASFITCEACNGSARVPYYRAIARIPRWFGRSIRFVWDTNIGVMRDCRAHGTTAGTISSSPSRCHSWPTWASTNRKLVSFTDTCSNVPRYFVST